MSIRSGALAAAILGAGLIHAAIAAEKYTIAEPAGDTRVFSVDVLPRVAGHLETAAGDGKAVAHKLDINAALRYRERRLSGAGRDAEAFRALRHYREAEARVAVGQQITSSRLRDQRRMMVARGQRDGVSLYSPAGPMSYEELELLRVPGDSLAALTLLPPKEVETGEKWTIPSWAAQMLTGTEAALKAEIVCTLQRVRGDVAHVEFSGRVEGASAGAAAEVDVDGHYLFDLRNGYLSHLELSQKEKRTVGPVTPGIDVTARIVLDRAPAPEKGPLSDEAAAAVPLDPDPASLLLEFRSPWNIRFGYDRNWHVFHQSDQVAVLRLLDKGSLVAQCNVSPVPAMAAGQHTSEEEFQADVREALGERLKKIESAARIPTDGNQFRFRVVATGEANKIPMQWTYYLCADPSGRQAAFVFAVEAKLAGQLANRDLAIVQSLEFLAEQPVPAKAESR